MGRPWCHLTEWPVATANLLLMNAASPFWVVCPYLVRFEDGSQRDRLRLTDSELAVAPTMKYFAKEYARQGVPVRVGLFISEPERRNGVVPIDDPLLTHAWALSVVRNGAKKTMVIYDCNCRAKLQKGGDEDAPIVTKSFLMQGQRDAFAALLGQRGNGVDKVYITGEGNEVDEDSSDDSDQNQVSSKRQPKRKTKRKLVNIDPQVFVST